MGEFYQQAYKLISSPQARKAFTLDGEPDTMTKLYGEYKNPRGGNIIGVNMRHRHSDFFDVDFDIEVKDARHLTHIAAALRACPSIETVERAKA